MSTIDSSEFRSVGSPGINLLGKPFEVHDPGIVAHAQYHLKISITPISLPYLELKERWIGAIKHQGPRIQAIPT